MKYLKIANEGLIDINALFLIGASSKREDNTKIGHFGSGLKYSLAVLLRMGIQPVFFIGAKMISITTSAVAMRGQDYQVITIDGQPTGFTTSMGPDWQLWYCLRELICNAMDEGKYELKIVEDVEPSTTETSIYIPFTEEVSAIMNDFDKYFSQDRKPIYTSITGVQIFERMSVEAYHGIIYRKGIRACEEERITVFDYNVQVAAINESRTFKSYWDVAKEIQIALMKCNDVKLIREFLKSIRNIPTLESMCTIENVCFHNAWLEVIGDTMCINSDIAGAFTEEYDLEQCLVLPAVWYYALIKGFGKAIRTPANEETSSGTIVSLNEQQLNRKVLVEQYMAKFDIKIEIKAIAEKSVSSIDNQGQWMILIPKAAFGNKTELLSACLEATSEFYKGDTRLNRCVAMCSQILLNIHDL